MQSLADGKYLGILFWSAFLGMALKGVTSDNTKEFFSNIADGVSQVVKWIINLAPFGIMGLVYSSISSNGMSIFVDYGALLLLLVGCMLTVALINIITEAPTADFATTIGISLIFKSL